MKKKNLSDLAKDALETAVFENNGLVLTRRLDVKIYQEIKTVLAEFGGKWHSKSNRHLFPDDTDWRQLLAHVIDTGEISLAKDSGYYPTPAQIVELMIDAADFKAADVFLEPSAGTGQIINLVRDFSARHKLNLDLFACELNPRFAGELRRRGLRVAEGDFLSFEAVSKADKILMNPPFENNGDIKHGLHAFRHLKTGGRMLIITRAGVDYGRTVEHARWREQCENYRTAVLDLPSGSFKSAGTLIETKLHLFEK